MTGEWKPIDTAPTGVWLETRLSTEKGFNICSKVVWPDGTVEWVERDTGVTTITHGSFAAPDLWRPPRVG